MTSTKTENNVRDCGNAGTGEGVMAQSVKYLENKHEDLNSNPPRACQSPAG